MFLYGPLRDRFPKAQFAMVLRDPRDNIRSICDGLSLPGDKSALDPSRYNKMTEEGNGSWMEAGSE